MRIVRTAAWALGCASIALAACGEKAAGAAKKADAPAFQGSTGAGAYVANGWKPGDQAAWEQQLRNRAQSQNEYARAAVKP